MSTIRNRRLIVLFAIPVFLVLGFFALYKVPSPISSVLHTQLRKTRAEIDSYDWGAAMPVTPVEMRVTAADRMKQVLVPEGKFAMGTDDTTVQKNRPKHTVFLSAFWIDQTEVTNAMYALCVDAGKCTYPVDNGSKPYYGNSKYANYPVVYVNWNEAANYCRWAGRRLPTDAEWEKAARGTDERLYPWGNQPPTTSLANFDMAIGGPLPVDRYPLGASPYGALNMAGNVREWVSDWFNEFYYLASPRENPAGPSAGETRSLRGGSYLDDGNEIRSFNRFFHPPDSPGVNRGFRCASDATQ